MRLEMRTGAPGAVPRYRYTVRLGHNRPPVGELHQVVDDDHCAREWVFDGVGGGRLTFGSDCPLSLVLRAIRDVAERNA